MKFTKTLNLKFSTYFSAYTSSRSDSDICTSHLLTSAESDLMTWKHKRQWHIHTYMHIYIHLF